MKQKEFSVLLDEMLKQLPYSKNDVIVRTGINRSTFYQFLNGKRFPTAKHMAAILGKAGFSEEDKKILEDAWGKAGTQYETYSALQSMLSCMDAICASESLRVGRPGRVVNTAAPGSGTSEDMLSRKGTAMLPGDEAGSEIQAASPHLTAASGSISVLSMIIGFIRRAAMPGSRGHISAFLPQRVLRVLEKSLQEFDSTFRGRLICQFPDEAGKGTRFAAEAFREVLPLVMDTECSVYAYYDSSDLARQTGLLYPYYVIGGGQSPVCQRRGRPGTGMCGSFHCTGLGECIQQDASLYPGDHAARKYAQRCTRGSAESADVRRSACAAGRSRKNMPGC